MNFRSRQGALLAVAAAALMATAPGAKAQALGETCGTLLTAACPVEGAAIQVVTTWRPPGYDPSQPDLHPEKVKVKDGFIGTPMSLDVDNDGKNDLRVNPQLIPQLQLRIEREFLVTADLPVMVEAIILTPSDEAHPAPRERVYLGYDARDGRAPVSHVTDIVHSTVAGGARVELDSTATPKVVGDPLTVVAGMYDGAPLDRVDPIAGRLRYAKVPSSSTIELTMADDHQKLVLTGNAPTVADASFELVEGADREHGTVHADQLPTSATLEMTKGEGENESTITYSAAAKITSIDATYREHVDGKQVKGARLRASGVPTAVTVHRASKEAVTVTTNSSFDDLIVGLADNGDPVFPVPLLPPYTNVPDTFVKVFSNAAGLSSVAARLQGLERASVDTTDTIDVDMEVTPAGSKPLTVYVDQAAVGDVPATDLEATVKDLPEHLTLSVDLDRENMTYDGHGQGIDEIKARAKFAEPFFDRPEGRGPNRLDLRILDVPASLFVNADTSPGAGYVVLDKPVGRLAARITTGPAFRLSPDDSESGFLLRDTTHHYVAYASLANVQAVSWRSGPTPSDPMQVSPLYLGVTGTEAQTFRIDAELERDYDDVPGHKDPFDKPGYIRGTIEKLPARFSLDRDQEGLHWAGSDAHGRPARIERVRLQGRALPPGPGGNGQVHAVDLVADDLPSRFSVLWGDPSKPTGISSADGTRFGRVFVQTSDAGGAPNPEWTGDPNGNTNAVSYREKHSGGFGHVTWVRLLDVERALYTAHNGDPARQKVDVEWGVADPAKLTVDVHNAGKNALSLHAELPTPPSEFVGRLRSEPDFRIRYVASEPLGTLFINGEIDDVLGVDLEIERLPPELSFCIGTGDPDPDVEGGQDRCDRQLPHTFKELDDLSIPGAVFSFLETEGTTQPRQVLLNGVLCMKPATTNADNPDRAPGPHYDPSCNYVAPPRRGDEPTFFTNTNNNVKFYDIQTSAYRFELLDGHSIQQDEDGDPLEDDLMAVRLDTPGFLGKVRFTSNNIDDPTEIHTQTSLDAHGPNPLVATNWEIYADLNGTGVAPGYFYGNEGTIDCSDTDLNVFEASGAPVEFFTFYPAACF